VNTAGVSEAAALLPFYLAVQRVVTTTAYANGFHLVGVITAVGAVLALLLPAGRPGSKPATSPASPTTDAQPERDRFPTPPRQRDSATAEDAHSAAVGAGRGH
jgi:hypothetical protein